MLFINDPLLAAYISLEILTIVITGKCWDNVAKVKGTYFIELLRSRSFLNCTTERIINITHSSEIFCCFATNQYSSAVNGHGCL
jgi:hypothetical protein